MADQTLADVGAVPAQATGASLPGQAAAAAPGPPPTATQSLEEALYGPGMADTLTDLRGGSAAGAPAPPAAAAPSTAPGLPQISPVRAALAAALTGNPMAGITPVVQLQQLQLQRQLLQQQLQSRLQANWWPRWKAPPGPRPNSRGPASYLANGVHPRNSFSVSTPWRASSAQSR